MIRWTAALALVGALIGDTAWADLRQAMGPVRSGDWSEAAAAVAGRPAVERAVVDWHRLRSGEAGFPAYLAFIEDYGDWPGMALLRRRGEASIPVGADPAQVRAFFGDAAPQTGPGVVRLAAALAAMGEADAADAVAIAGWTGLRLTPASERALLAAHGTALRPHHAARMDHLLWEGALEAAGRMRPLVPAGWQALHDARVALRRDTPGVDARIAAVPADLADDPGLAWERLEWRARRNRTSDVIALMLERSVSAESLGRPEKWGPRRRALARDLFLDGRVREAYLLAAQNHLERGADFADLEWLAGYLALTRLDTPGAALAHFRRLRAQVASPISLGRAGYWEGRAHEALGQPAEAAAAYGFAAEFQVSFYGQLAAEKAGLPMDPRLTGREVFPVPRDSALRETSVFRAAMALWEAEETGLAVRFFAHLAEGRSRSEVGELLSLTEPLASAYLQLTIAKRAAREGHMLHRSYFPMVEMPVAQGVPRELALSVARRESEFNPVVVSPAGALGLMQVMPATARATAARLGLPFARSRLTADADYNARIGSAYLDELRDQFGEATILVAAGYNAGPGRPVSWIERNGDPRSAAIDAVDWIEAIPFRETRNYVMRVMEGILPYRAQIAGETLPWTLTAEIEAR